MPQYRGYQIRLMPADGHKRVEINPIYPDLPILRRAFFKVEPSPDGEVLNTAKRLIDEVLALCR